MIAALVIAAVLQTPQTPSDLLFSEAWACATLARVGRETHFGETTPQTTSEHAMWDALTRLERLANEEADRKQVSQGYDAEQRAVQEGYARDMLGRATGDQLGEMLETCASVFGVSAP